MKNRLVLTLVFSVFLISISKAENPCGIMYPYKDTTSWGIGFIRLPNNITLKACTYKTNTVCYIQKGKIRFNNDSSIRITQEDVVYLGSFGSVLLKVYKINDTRYKICSNSLKESIWVDYDDFSEKGLDFNTYLSVLRKDVKYISDDFQNSISYANANIGINLIKSCLYLRTKPSIEGEIITCLKNNSFEKEGHTHMKILNLKDGWAWVMAYEYEYDSENDESGEGCAFKVVREYQGWVKVIGKNGRPTIWYSVTSY